MFKHFIPVAVLCGLLAGCQSVTPNAEREAVPPKLPEHMRVTQHNTAPPVPENDIANKPPEVPEEIKKQGRKYVMILMKTSKGDIKIELNRKAAPKTVANFLSYVETGHYTGTIFHRVMDGFMIQGGGFTASMSQKNAPRTVENEANNGLKNATGSIAMARTSDPHSAGAQFFINVNDNDFLNYPGQDGWGYCVFGKVVEGMDVVNAIKSVPTGNAGPHQNVPTEPILIESISVIEE